MVILLAVVALLAMFAVFVALTLVAVFVVLALFAVFVALALFAVFVAAVASVEAAISVEDTGLTAEGRAELVAAPYGLQGQCSGVRFIHTRSRLRVGSLHSESWDARFVLDSRAGAISRIRTVEARSAALLNNRRSAGSRSGAES